MGCVSSRQGPTSCDLSGKHKSQKVTFPKLTDQQ